METPVHPASPANLLHSRVSLKVRIRDPLTRAAQVMALGEFLLRVEVCLGFTVKVEWVPVLVAMADGLFLQRGVVLDRATTGRGFVESPGAEYLPNNVLKLLGELQETGAVEVATVEEIYRSGRLAQLQLPRTWELNGWWENLYGMVPMPPAFEEEGDDDEVWEEGVDLKLEIKPHPVGLQSEDNQVRILMEKGLLSQYEPLFRLKMSVHEQARALGVLLEGWVVDAQGAVHLNPGLVGSELLKGQEKLATWRRQQKKWGPLSREALEHLEKSGRICLTAQGYVLAS